MHYCTLSENGMVRSCTTYFEWMLSTVRTCVVECWVMYMHLCSRYFILRRNERSLHFWRRASFHLSWQGCWCNLVGRLSFSCPVEGHVALMWYIYMLTFLSLVVSMNKNSPTFILSAPFVLCSLMLRSVSFFLSPIFVTLKISLLLYLAECWCVLILFSWHKCQHCFLGNKRRHFLQCYRYNCYLLNSFADYEIEVFVLISGLLIVVDRCMKPLNFGRQQLEKDHHHPSSTPLR